MANQPAPAPAKPVETAPTAVVAAIATMPALTMTFRPAPNGGGRGSKSEILAIGSLSGCFGPLAIDVDDFAIALKDKQLVCYLPAKWSSFGGSKTNHVGPRMKYVTDDECGVVASPTIRGQKDIEALTEAIRSAWGDVQAEAKRTGRASVFGVPVALRLTAAAQ